MKIRYCVKKGKRVLLAGNERSKEKLKDARNRIASEEANGQSLYDLRKSLSKPEQLAEVDAKIQSEIKLGRLPYIGRC